MLHCGTSGWAYASWKPDFYPAKLGAAKFLGYYAARLNSVEVNYTFRRLPGESLLAKWIADTPAGFRFAIKAHQAITHFRRLRDAAGPTSKFIAAIEPLRAAGKLGPVLVQLPPNLKCDLALLADFLNQWPGGLRATIEFRHPSWFAEDVYALLRKSNVALCQAETSGLETPPVATADFAYFRFRKDDYSKTEIAQLAARTALPSARDVFAYFKHEDTPAGALWAETLLHTASGTPPPAPG